MVMGRGKYLYRRIENAAHRSFELCSPFFLCVCVCSALHGIYR